jgi:hypothetical protein
MIRAGRKVAAMQDARGAQWTKLIFNSAVSLVCQLGVLAPLNRALWQQMKGIEYSWADRS